MSKAKLFVRGAGVEPIELEPEEAEAAQKLIGDATKPNDTPFSIEGVWSGKKADMKFVVFPKKEQEVKYERVEAYSKQEAEDFDKEYLPFKEQAKKEGYNSAQGVWLWLESIGAVRLERWEHEKTGKHLTPFVRPEPYEAAMKRLERRDAYHDKVAYAKAKEMEELEKMAEQNTPV
jgi:hypothetical protein